MQKNIIHTAICDGMNGLVVGIESQFVRGFSGLQMIGNISESLRDSKERARTALEVLSVHIPPRKLIMSITPADVKKTGNQFDLGIAVSLLLLLNKDTVSTVDASNFVFVSELSLTGDLKGVKGVISYAIAAVTAGFKGLIVAGENLADLAILQNLNSSHFNNLQIMGFAHLAEVRNWLYGNGDSLPVPVTKNHDVIKTNIHDFNDMILDPEMLRVALCLAVGKHSLIMYGPPGTGKSMFALRLPSILPKLETQEHLQALKIGSSHAVNIDEKLLAGHPPFRSPHHSASVQGVLGTTDQPGDIALAHGGVLFLDELPEFRRDIIEALREPLETGEIHISRAKMKVSWCAKLILIAATNNCPCGYWGSSKKKCTCALNKVIAYRRKLSGPIMDRIDMHINVAEKKNDSAMLFDLIDQGTGDQTSALHTRVQECLAFNRERNKTIGCTFNSTIPARHLMTASNLSAVEFKRLLATKFLQTLSKRSLLKTLRVARTLADLDLSATLTPAHLQEAYTWQAESASRERGDFAIGL